MIKPIRCKDGAYRKAYLTYLDNLESRANKLFIEIKAAVPAAKELSRKAERKKETQNE